MKKIYLLLVLLISVSCNKDTNVVNSNCVCSNPLLDSISIIKVIDVIDGDTFKVKIQNDIFSIRVLNIDCFETKNNDRLKEQSIKSNISIDSCLSLGIKARETAVKLLLNKDVTLIRNFKDNNFDVYNRLLRDVYIDTLNYADYLINNNLVVK